MPPMLSGSVGGIRPGLTMAWKHNRMPPFCKTATRTFKITETQSVAQRPRRLFYDMLLTLRCANIFTPGRAIRWLSGQWRFRCAWFLAPGSPEHRQNALYRGCRLSGVRICSHLKLQLVSYQADAVLGARSSAYLEEQVTIYRIENVREKVFLCTEYSGTHLWCRKRTSGVPNEPRGNGNIPDWHRVRKATFPPEA